jgi:hypothetical protein
MLTVTVHSGLVRFTTQDSIKELRVEIFSLAGEKLFDSGVVHNKILNWKAEGVGNPVLVGVYLYSATLKDSAGQVSKQVGKLVLARGQTTQIAQSITLPTVRDMADTQPLVPNELTSSTVASKIQFKNISLQELNAISRAMLNPSLLDQQSPSLNYVPDELLVRFRSETSSLPKSQIHAAIGTTVLHEYQYLPNLQHIKLDPLLTVEEAIKLFKNYREVLYAEPNFFLRIPEEALISQQVVPQLTPNDTRYGEQWALNNTGQSGGTPDNDIDAPEAWNILTGSSNVVVAILDAVGVKYMITQILQPICGAIRPSVTAHPA